MTTLRVLSIPDPQRASDQDVRRCAAIAGRGGLELALLLPRDAALRGAGSDGVRILAEPVRRRASFGLAPTLGSTTYPRLGAVLREMRPDIIHLHASPRSALASSVARLRGTAALVLECEDESPRPRLLPDAALRLAERRVLHSADLVLGRHYGVLTWARRRGFTGPGAVVAYGVDALPKPPSAAERATDLALGFIGALTPGSGIVEIVEAVAAARAPIALSILGQGPLQDEIVDRAAALRIGAKLQLNGASTDARRRAEFLHSLNALVITQRCDGGGRELADRVIAESQAAGVPVISFGAPGGHEFVGDAGWCVAAGDAGLLSRLLRRLATRRDELERAAASCASHVQWHASLAIVAAELERAFLRARQRRDGAEISTEVSLGTSHEVKP